VPGRHASGRIRQSRTEWLVLVKDVYPAYITWEEYERIQATIEENRQKMEERLTRKQAIRSGAALLTGLVRCGLCGHAMRVIYTGYGHQYQCKAWTSKYAKPNCQYLAGKPIDEAVVQEFFRVLQLAEIDALQRVDARQTEHQRELEQHLEQEVKRLEHAAKLAERQYDNVDPENRLIASTLETRWESALAELEQPKARLAELRARSPQPVAIPAELRDAFADAGRRLPELWERLPIEARKTMLRALVAGVNLSRDGSGVLRIRIVWRGGLVSERSRSRSARSAARNGKDASSSESAFSPAQDKPTSRSPSNWSGKDSHLAREGGSRRRSSRSIVASTKFVRVWAGSAAATGHQGTRSSKWPSSLTSTLNGSIAGSPRAESRSPRIQDTDVICFRARRPPWLA